MSETAPADARQGRPAPEHLALFALILLRIAVSAGIYPWIGYLENLGLLLFVFWMLVRRTDRGVPPAMAAGLALYFLPVLLALPVGWLSHGRYGSILPEASARFAAMEIGNLLLFGAVTIVGRRGLAAVAAAVATGAILSAAFALRQRLGGFEATLAVEGISEYARQTLLEARVFGLTFSPDLLAATIAGALPLAAVLALRGWKSERLSYRVLPPIAIVILLVVLGLTRSLGGFLATAGGLGVLLLFWPGISPARRRAILLAATGVALAGATAIIMVRGGHFFDLDNWNNPLRLRLDNWRTALAVWREFPLTGAGPGQYGLAMFAHRSLLGNEAKHVHNMLLETLAETGPVGLLGLLVIILAFVRSSLAGIRAGGGGTDESDSLLLAGFFASGAAMLGHGTIDFSLSAPEVAALFWIALGVAAGGAEARPRIGSFRPRLVLVFSLVLLGSILIFFSANSKFREEAVRLEREKDPAGALAAADRALLLQPADDEMFALKSRALAAGNRKSLDEIIFNLEAAIRLNPRNPFYPRDLGLLEKDPRIRIEKLRRAVALYPNSAPLNTVLGRVLLDRGDYREAEKTLLHAAGCGRESGDAMTLLGMFYARSGKMKEAESWLRHGAAAEPRSEERAKALADFLQQRK